MGLLDIPPETLHLILRYASQDGETREFCGYRLVNHFMDEQIKQLCWTEHLFMQKGHLHIGPFAYPRPLLFIESEDEDLRESEDEDRPENEDADCPESEDEDRPEPFIYTKNRLSRNDLEESVCKFLMSTTSTSLPFLRSLRIAMAVLMNTKHLSFNIAQPENLKTEVTISDGLIDAYPDSKSQARFAQVAASVAATIIYTADSKILYEAALHPDVWYKPFETEIALNQSDNNIEWALATATYLTNIDAVRDMLKCTIKSDGKLKLASAENDERNPVLDADDGKSSHRDESACVNALSIAIQKHDHELTTLFLGYSSKLINNNTRLTIYDSFMDVAARSGLCNMVTLLCEPQLQLQMYDMRIRDSICAAVRCPCSHGNGQAAQCAERIAIFKKIEGTSWDRNNHFQVSRNVLLGEACKAGCLTIVQYLVEGIKTDTNFGSHSYFADAGCSYIKPLACAAIHGHLDVMEYLLTYTAVHFPPLFPIYRIGFREEFANREMMANLEETNAMILREGPLEPDKARYLLSAAKRKGYTKVVEMLTRGGVVV